MSRPHINFVIVTVVINDFSCIFALKSEWHHSKWRQPMLIDSILWCALPTSGQTNALYIAKTLQLGPSIVQRIESCAISNLDKT